MCLTSIQVVTIALQRRSRNVPSYQCFFRYKTGDGRKICCLWTHLLQRMPSGTLFVVLIVCQTTHRTPGIRIHCSFPVPRRVQLLLLITGRKRQWNVKNIECFVAIFQTWSYRPCHGHFPSSFLIHCQVDQRIFTVIDDSLLQIYIVDPNIVHRFVEFICFDVFNSCADIHTFHNATKDCHTWAKKTTKWESDRRYKRL